MSDLKPCPFCKSGAHTFHGWLWHVACDDCGCKLTGFVTEAEAIEAWNTRTCDKASDKEAYDAGFTSGIKATLQQLYGLLHEYPSLDDIEAWADRQWEEEI